MTASFEVVRLVFLQQPEFSRKSILIEDTGLGFELEQVSPATRFYKRLQGERRCEKALLRSDNHDPPWHALQDVVHHVLLRVQTITIMMVSKIIGIFILWSFVKVVEAVSRTSTLRICNAPQSATAQMSCNLQCTPHFHPISQGPK